MAYGSFRVRTKAPVALVWGEMTRFFWGGKSAEFPQHHRLYNQASKWQEQDTEHSIYWEIQFWLTWLQRPSKSQSKILITNTPRIDSLYILTFPLAQFPHFHVTWIFSEKVCGYPGSVPIWIPAKQPPKANSKHLHYYFQNILHFKIWHSIDCPQNRTKS
jgi:hypothetical protein